MDFFRPPTTQGTLDALAALYRAVRAWRFYPKGHPTRRNSLHAAYSELRQLQDGNTLHLVCGRTGFSYPDGEFLKDASGPSPSLAFELFIRRAQKITFDSDLFLDDLLELLKILCMSPETVHRSGGIDELMARRGIRTIWVNEFDVATIRSRRLRVEQSGIVPEGLDKSEEWGDTAIMPEALQETPETVAPESRLQSLLGRLSACGDDDTYLILLRQAVSCIGQLTLGSPSHPLRQFLELLAGHAGDESRSTAMRDSALFAIEQTVVTPHVQQHLFDSLEAGILLSDTALRSVLIAGGTAAVSTAIEVMGRTGNLKIRKTIATAVGSVGESAIPALLNLMQDDRWFIIRNICAILGVIGHQETVGTLTKCLHYPDLRVRKEAARSLAQIGGLEAESALIGVLRGSDEALYPQAIISLGGMKSRHSLTELMKIVRDRDLFLQTLQLKIDALNAIAIIGDGQVAPVLASLLDERHLLASARGKQLKIAIAGCLGKLGDRRVIARLRQYTSDSGELGAVCSEAIRSIEKQRGAADGIS